MCIYLTKFIMSDKNPVVELKLPVIPDIELTLQRLRGNFKTYGLIRGEKQVKLVWL